MGKTRRIIRKQKPQGAVAFEDQLWPVMVSLIVLGGYLAGIILAVFSLSDPRILHNAITWLILLPLAIGGSMFAVSRISSRKIRRGILLSAVLSLMVNVTIFLILAAYQMIPKEFKPLDPILRQAREQVVTTEPDYVVAKNRPQKDFEKPIEVPTPERKEKEIPHKETNLDPPKKRPNPTPTPEPQKTTRPNVIKRKKEVESVPRQSEHRSKLSRQITKTRPSITLPKVAVKKVVPVKAKPPAKLKAESSQLARQTPKQPSRREPTALPKLPQPTVKSVTRPRRKMARRNPTSRPVANPKTTPRRTTPKRQRLAKTLHKPAVSRVAARPSSKPKRTPSKTLQPAKTPLRRTVTTPTRPTRRVAKQTNRVKLPSTIPTTKPTVSRRKQQNSRPKIARTPVHTPTIRRTTKTTAIPSTRPIVAKANRPSSTKSRSENAPLRPQATQVVRQTAPRSRSPRTAALPGGSPVTGPKIPQPNPSPTRRTKMAMAPAINPNVKPSRTPARTRSAFPSSVAVSPATTASKALLHTNRPTDHPSLAPSSQALTRATTGRAGAGHSANLSRGAPASSNAIALRASTSANRRRETRATEPGASLSSQQVARTSRARASAKSPAAHLKAQRVNTATDAGAKQVAENQADATGALVRTSSDAAAGKVSAPKGIGDVDLGTTQIVANTGTGRASGGGQPTLNFSNKKQVTRRKTPGGGLSVALASNVKAATANAPKGSSGGPSEMPLVDAETSSLTRGTTGGEGSARAMKMGEASLPGSAPVLGESRTARTEANPADAGQPSVGEGQPRSLTRRNTSSVAFAANRRAKAAAAGTDTNTDTSQEDGGPSSELAAQGGELLRDASPGDAQSGAPRDAAGLVGGPAGPEGIESPISAESGSSSGTSRRRSQDGPDGPSIEATANNGPGPPRRKSTRRGKMPGNLIGTPGKVASSEGGAKSPEANPDVDTLLGGSGMDASGVTRETAGGALQVRMETSEGPGGLGEKLAKNAGINRKKATHDSPEIHTLAKRFRRERAGGKPNLNTMGIRGTEAFSRRSPIAGNKPGGSKKSADATGDAKGPRAPETEQAIELGLAFLARHQSSDGSWSLNNFGATQPQFEEEYVDERASLRSDTAATGLSVLAFLGAGYQHKDFKYKNVVQGGLDFLIRNQKENGDLYLPQDAKSTGVVWLYSHGIATLTLCEAYGMTRDPKLREPAQKAIDFIVKSQHAKHGGWRYSPGKGSDTSVTGWLMTAMQAGRLAGLKVPDEPFQKIRKQWLDHAQASKKKPYLYVYNPYAPKDDEKQSHGRQVNKTMTSVGLLMRLYLGWDRDKKEMLAGADYLLDHLPAIGTTRAPERDAYYWYYATQVMCHIGGERYKRWQEALHPLLTKSQAQRGTFRGSWDPIQPVPDRWAPFAGRIYVTTLNLLTLEVDHRLLPLYKKTAK